MYPLVLTSLILVHSAYTHEGRIYKKGQKGANIKWSNDEHLLSIGRQPNPPWPRGKKEIIKHQSEKKDYTFQLRNF